MKVIGYTLVVLVMGLLGHALYPNIRPTFEQAGWIRPLKQVVPEARVDIAHE